MKKTAFFAAASLAVLSVSSQAAWTTISLPNTSNYGNTAMAHLADGRFVYGHSGTMLLQDTFGSAAASSYANAPAGDYAFLTSKYYGAGAWSAGPVASYNNGNTATAFTPIGTHQTFAAANYGSGLLFVGTFGGNSTLVHLTDGNVTTALIDKVSTNSGGFALSDAGDLFIADNDDLNLYRFSSAQITAAIGGTQLSMANGTYVGNLGVSGSLAYDPNQNRLYATGWQTSGIRFLDLDDSSTGTIVPGLANSNYQVMTFSVSSSNYVGWLNRNGWNGGDTVTYGYDLAANVVPEPAAIGLLALSATVFFLRRRRTVGPAGNGLLD